ncbi:MAG: phosphate acyltransferase PlsX [Planctomycetes bacterium]|nr:phosphate acyltransferase PlsX [Planctomycetota bacterium]
MSCSIAVDAMGGDHAPDEIVEGALRAAQELQDSRICLVGQEEPIHRRLEALAYSGNNITVLPAETVIDMGDSPVDALRKKRGSSIEVAVKLVRSGDAQAFVSAGNTGACVVAAQLIIGLLPKVKKPGILVTILAGDHPVSIIDAGANVAPKPLHLVQYGIMASIFTSEIIRIDNPRVGLLNIGGEDRKGNKLVKATKLLFEESQLNFRGYVEGDEIFRGSCDVIICDGFTGNAVLKVSEGLAERLMAVFQNVLETSLGSLGPLDEASETCGGGTPADVLRRSLISLRRKVDYSEYGGAPLLGVNGVVIIAHGRSDSKAIFNAVRVAKRMVDGNINGHITERI